MTVQRAQPACVGVSYSRCHRFVEVLLSGDWLRKTLALEEWNDT
jgi:hypothetical protein